MELKHGSVAGRCRKKQTRGEECVGACEIFSHPVADVIDGCMLDLFGGYFFSRGNRAGEKVQRCVLAK